MGTPSHEDTGQNHNLEIEMDGKSHPENVLSSDALQYGYKESMEGMGISESKEVELSLAHRTDLWKGTCMRTFQQVWMCGGNLWALHLNIAVVKSFLISTLAHHRRSGSTCMLCTAGSKQHRCRRKHPHMLHKPVGWQQCMQLTACL